MYYSRTIFGGEAMEEISNKRSENIFWSFELWQKNEKYNNKTKKSLKGLLMRVYFFGWFRLFYCRAKRQKKKKIVGICFLLIGKRLKNVLPKNHSNIPFVEQRQPTPAAIYFVLQSKDKKHKKKKHTHTHEEVYCWDCVKDVCIRWASFLRKRDKRTRSTIEVAHFRYFFSEKGSLHPTLH